MAIAPLRMFRFLAHSADSALGLFAGKTLSNIAPQASEQQCQYKRVKQIILKHAYWMDVTSAFIIYWRLQQNQGHRPAKI